MYIKRLEIQKKFESKEMAVGFAKGIDFVGVREYKFKEIIDCKTEFIVVLEKLERSKT